MPVPLEAFALTSLSLPDRSLPHLPGHLEAALADDGSSGAFISDPAAPGVLSHPTAFLVSMVRLLARGVFLGWGRGGQFQLRIPEGGGVRSREGRSGGHHRGRPLSR